MQILDSQEQISLSKLTEELDSNETSCCFQQLLQRNVPYKANNYRHCSKACILLSFWERAAV